MRENLSPCGSAGCCYRLLQVEICNPRDSNAY